MAEILRKSYHAYNYMFHELPDQRVKHWFLVAKPYEFMLVLGLYLMFVLKWGPKYMQNKPPYNLDKTLKIYNGCQVIACAVVLFEGIRRAWGWDYKFICEPVDFSEKGADVLPIVYLYFLLKVIDLLDTVFFVLRKKFNQVSFLHIYHHTGMVLLVWGTMTYLPGGHGTMVGIVNSLVHIVMYSYYLLTVAFPSIKQQLWWKKYITQLQIIQFFWNVMHMGTIVFVPDCGFPRWTAAVFLPQNIFMLILFLDFYRRAYIQKPIKRTFKNRNNSEIGSSRNIYENGNGKQNGVSNGSMNENVYINAVSKDTIYRNGASKENVYRNGSSKEIAYKNGDSFGKTHENGIKKDN